MNHAPESLGSLSDGAPAIKAMNKGRPELTAKPPKLAINIRTDVRMVISLVSRVSDEFNAPYGTLINV